MGLASKIKNSDGPSAAASAQQNTQYSHAPSAPPYYTAPSEAGTTAPQQPYGQHQPYGQQQPYYGSGYPASYPYPQHQPHGQAPLREQSSPQPYGQSYGQASVKEQPYSQPYGYPASSPYAQPYPGHSHGEKLESTPPTAYPMFPHAPPHAYGAGYGDGARNYAQSLPYQAPTGAGYRDGAPNYTQSLPYPSPTVQPPYASSASNNARDVMAQKLQSIIQSNGLQHFYDPAGFQSVLQKVVTIDFGEIAAQWKIGKELAYDLAPLALYDIVFYCDDSGSMAFEENGERIDDLKFILLKVSGIATLFDDDGVIVRFMNSNVNGDGVCSAADVVSLISQVRFSGATPLGTNFDRKVIQPFVIGQATSNASRMAKPVLAIIITDGEPYGEAKDTIAQVIRRAKDSLARTPYGSGALAVQIAQVGKDAKTQKFLDALDKDPIVGGMIDCTSYYEMEEEEFARKGVTLTPELWLLKMCVGAIDPEYDSKDD